MMRWDWQHTAIVISVVVGVTAIVVAGKADDARALLAALGGTATLIALAKRSPLEGP